MEATTIAREQCPRCGFDMRLTMTMTEGVEGQLVARWRLVCVRGTRCEERTEARRG